MDRPPRERFRSRSRAIPRAVRVRVPPLRQGSVRCARNSDQFLRSMGYRRRDISAIFLWQGALIAAAGSVLGCLLGALMTWGVSHIPIHLRGLLYTNYFLVTWDWHHYLFATFLALVLVFIARYVPARRAAQLPPVVTIRGSR